MRENAGRHFDLFHTVSVCLSQGGSAVGAGGQRVDERGQRTELAQPSAYDPPHHQSHPLVREVSHWLLSDPRV